MTAFQTQNQIIANHKYDKFNEQYFKGGLPKFEIIFKKLYPRIERGETHPELKQIWMAEFYLTVDLSKLALSDEFERDLKHEMIHVYLWKKHPNGNWGHTKEFNCVADRMCLPHY